MSKGKTLLAVTAQLVAIAIFAVWWYSIISKGHHDIVALMQQKAIELWRAMLEYFVRNIGGSVGP